MSKNQEKSTVMHKILTIIGTILCVILIPILVINCMRPLTRTKDEILDLSLRIMNRGRLKIDLIINNTNLADETTTEMIEEGEKMVLECAEVLNCIPVITAGNKDLLRKSRLSTPIFSVKRYMKPEWME